MTKRRKPGKIIDREGFPFAEIKNKSIEIFPSNDENGCNALFISDAKKLHKWLGQAIAYLESRKGRVKK